MSTDGLHVNLYRTMVYLFFMPIWKLLILSKFSMRQYVRLLSGLMAKIKVSVPDFISFRVEVSLSKTQDKVPAHSLEVAVENSG